MRYFIEAILNPFFIALILLAITCGCAFLSLQKNKLVTVSSGLSLLIFLIFSTSFIPQLLTRTLEDQYSPVYQAHINIPYVVVLSGGQSNRKNLPPTMQLYASSQQRLWEGLRLIDQLPKAKLVLSGGAFNRQEGSEALHLKHLVQYGCIARKQIILEDKSLNTKEQAVFLKNIIQNNTFYLVTSAIHMPRAMSLMQAQGLHPIAAPTAFTHYWDDERWTKRFIPNPYNLVYSSIAMHELLGRLFYSLVL